MSYALEGSEQGDVINKELSYEELREIGQRLIRENEAARGDVALLLGAIILRDNENKHLSKALAEAMMLLADQLRR